MRWAVLGMGNGLGEKSSHLQGRERGTQAGAGVASTSGAGAGEGEVHVNIGLDVGKA